jgi:anti-anti-sigma factor
VTDGLLLKIEHAADQVVLAVTGEIDAATCSTLEQAGTTLLVADEATTLVLDFAEVTFCDSACLRVLLKLRDAASVNGGSVQIRGASGLVARVFEVTGLGPLFGMPPTGAAQEV